MTDIATIKQETDIYNFDGVDYCSVKFFASKANKTTQTIYNLISKGNAIRRLKVKYVDGKPLIPVSELEDFLFTCTGPGSAKRSYKCGK